MNTVRIGLIGVRGFGEKIASIILNSPKLELAQCYHYDRSVCQEYAEKYSCAPAYLLEELMGNEQLDAVAIITPNHLHYEQIIMALKNDKHVFIEKPITKSVQTALQVGRKLKEKENLVFMIGHSFRRKRVIRKIKELIDEGVLGSIVTAEINVSHGGAFNWNKTMWRWHQSTCEGGPLIMNGVHMSDTLEYLIGPIESASSIVKKLYAPTEAQDTSLSLVEFESGATGYICNNYNIPSVLYLNIYGTEGSVFCDFETLFIRRGRDINRVPSPKESVPFEKNDEYEEEIEDFAEAILNKGSVETGFNEGLRAILFVESALKSSSEERKVLLREVKKEIGNPT